MTLQDIANSYGITPEEVRNTVLTVITQDFLQENTKSTGEMTLSLVGTIKRVLNQNGYTPIKANETTASAESDVSADNETEKDKQPEVPQAKTPKKIITEIIPSDISSIPPVVLRKFYAQNFKVKPETIFYMDDQSVTEKVNEKYLVFERNSDYIFIKRNASIISVKK